MEQVFLADMCILHVVYLALHAMLSRSAGKH